MLTKENNSNKQAAACPKRLQREGLHIKKSKLQLFLRTL
jgi:hypothetical protein